MPPFTQSSADDHLSEATLRQFLNGHLSGSAAFQAEGHLASCAQCRARLDEIVLEGDAANTSFVALTQAFARKGLPSPSSQFAPRVQQYPDFEAIEAYVDGTLALENAREFEVLMRRLPRLAQEVVELRALKENLHSAPSSRPVETTDATPLVKLPPMIVQPVIGTTPRLGWNKWRWFLQSAGVVVPSALFIFASWNLAWQKERSAQLHRQIARYQRQSEELQHQLTVQKQEGEKREAQSLRQASDERKQRATLMAEKERLRNALTARPVPSPLPSSRNPFPPNIPIRPNSSDGGARPSVSATSSAGNSYEASPSATPSLSSEPSVRRGAGGDDIAAPTQQLAIPLTGLRDKDKPLLVALGRGVTWGEPIVKELATSANTNLFRLAYPGEKANVKIVLESNPQAFSRQHSTPVREKVGQPNYYVLDWAGRHIYGAFPSVEELKDALKNYCIQSRLLALQNPAGQEQSLLDDVDIQVEGADYFVPHLQQHDFKTPKQVLLSQKMIMKVGEDIRFQLKNRTNKTLYVAMLWLSRTGMITVIEKKDATKSRDGTNPAVIQLNPTATPGDEAVTLIYQAPFPGAEKLKIFVSTQSIDPYYLELDELKRSTSQPSGTLSSLDVVLGQALGTRLEKKITDPVDTNTWSLATSEFSINNK